MMMKKLALMTCLASGLVLAADIPGFLHWSAPAMKEYEKKAAPKVPYGNHSITVGHRDSSGEPEVHEAQNDIFVIQSGEATLLVGGKLAGSKTVSPGELRGAGIDGGEKVKLAAGDVVHIPAKTPHQLILAPGKQLTYLVVKVETAK